LHLELLRQRPWHSPSVSIFSLNLTKLPLTPWQADLEWQAQVAGPEVALYEFLALEQDLKRKQELGKMGCSCPNHVKAAQLVPLFAQVY